MLHVVAYDISSPLRLKRAAKKCEDFGTRIEKSLFECDLGSEDFGRFWDELSGIIDPAEDFLVAYPVCAGCEKAIRTAGVVRRPEKPLAYIF